MSAAGPPTADELWRILVAATRCRKVGVPVTDTGIQGRQSPTHARITTSATAAACSRFDELPSEGELVPCFVQPCSVFFGRRSCQHERRG